MKELKKKFFFLKKFGRKKIGNILIGYTLGEKGKFSFVLANLHGTKFKLTTKTSFVGWHLEYISKRI